MHQALQKALEEAAPLIATRGWNQPTPATITAAERLLDLVERQQRPPTLQVDPGGTISFEWEAADHGWLTLTVDDQGQLTHSAVLGEDEFTQTEAFGDALPDWAATLLQRLLAAGH
jgi:plastocyanin